ncbi:alpha-ribazole phosphatase [Candidatus Rariloculus sp.]|uniref:alpha-ribazole phosphatase n=1 Tax=Candidatus Rariloculus sp. TaxID=3101265 RepID=UPI003D0D9B32
MAVILVRHTRPAVPKGMCYGRMDVGLADTFAEEAAAVLAALPSVHQVVTSPLNRCLQLAKYIAEARNLPIEVDGRLMELDFGRWEGRPWSAVPEADLDAWARDFMLARPHGGESIAMLRDRVAAVLSDWSARRKSVAIVTHAGVIRAACEPRTDEPWDFRPSVDFGGIIVLGDSNRI